MPVVLWSATDWAHQSPDIASDAIKQTLEQVYQATTIYSRFDALVELIQQCATAAATSNNQAPYNTLKEQATQFASAIVDAKNPADLTQKIAQRNQYKAIDPDYMPWNSPGTRADVTQVANRQEYVTAATKLAIKNVGQKNYNQVNAEDKTRDSLNQVKYLTAEEREEFRILISDGKFKKIQLSENEENLVLDNFDTKQYAAHETLNEAIFVLAPKGDIFAGSTDPEVFHHSSFLAGNANPFAGTLTVTNGNTQKVTDNSGHYLPPAPVTIKMLAFLRQTGVLDVKPASEVWNENFLRFDVISNSPTYELNSMEGLELDNSTHPFFNQNKTQTFVEAIHHGDLAEVKSMIAAGADLTKMDDDGRTPLAIAAMKNHQEIFTELVTRSTPEQLNQQDRYAMTPLLLAVAKNNTEIAVKLIEQGANPNITNSTNLAPLTMAAWNDNATVVNSLRNNADTTLDNERLSSMALRKNNDEVIALLAQKVDFSHGVAESINASELQPVIKVLSHMSDHNTLDSDALSAVSSEVSNLPSEYITYLEDLPKEQQQNAVNMVLGKQNALGMLLDENSLLDTLKKRLNNNGFNTLVNNFNDAGEVAVTTKSHGATANVLAMLQKQEPKPAQLQEIEMAKDYVAPKVAAVDYVRKADKTNDNLIQPQAIVVNRR
jgi:ankyrin repeat protein